jgi:hypothetical protein
LLSTFHRVYKFYFLDDGEQQSKIVAAPRIRIGQQGEVIGMNTAGETEAQGIGFAIPSSTIKEVYNELVTAKSSKNM